MSETDAGKKAERLERPRRIGGGTAEGGFRLDAMAPHGGADTTGAGDAFVGGFLHCLDAETGEVYWVYDTFAAIWGSPLVVDGRVYLGDEDGDVVVLKAGKELEVIAENYLGSAVYSTPVPANGVLFLGSRNQLFALVEN